MKIFWLLSNPHITDRICKNPPLVPILGQMDLIHASHHVYLTTLFKYYT